MLENIMLILNYPAIFWIIFVFVALFINSTFPINLGKRLFKIAIFITLIAISIFAFNYIPTIYTDLYRHYLRIDLIRYHGQSFYNASEIITSILFEIVAATPYNQLLPFITSLVRYSLFASILLTFMKKFNYHYRVYQLYLFFFFAYFSIIESISGVRYYLAITFIFYALIKEFVFEKSKLISYLNYIVALLFHMSSSMFLGIRFLMIEKIYNFIKPFRYMIIFWSYASDYMAKILDQLGTPLTNSISTLLLYYINEERDISPRLIAGRLIAMLVLLSMYYMIKSRDEKLVALKINFYRYFELTILFTLGSFFYDVFFQRGVFFTVLISMPLVFDFFESNKISKNTKTFYRIVIIIISLAMYANQIYGMLTGYM